MTKKIMLIDDEESVRKAMSGILARKGYELSLFDNGIDALDSLNDINPDLIILDMHMPRMDGLAFLKNIRENRMTIAPVLMVTGSADPELKARSYRLGVYDYINKPEDTEVMLKRIENGLKIGEMINFNEFIKIELMMARKLQTYLFPPMVLDTPKVNIQTVTKPLSDIGGDLFDYIEFRDGRVIFFVADVSGHSISAALYTAIVKMVFRNAIKDADTPAGIMTLMNRELSGNIPIESFVTVFCGMLDFSSSLLYYCNAGHPAPLVMTGNEIDVLEGSDSFLGPIRDAEFHNLTWPVAAGSRICLFTDGALDPGEGGAGDEWIRKILKSGKFGLDELFQLLRINIMERPASGQDDDRTLMLVRIK